MKFELSRQVSKNAKISNFNKIRPVGAELFHVDGQTGRHVEANNRFTLLCEESAQVISSLVMNESQLA
jgi:hypothetical protein